jgi:methylmalonyl-CoA mutase N-terminal domain/subunit
VDHVSRGESEPAGEPVRPARDKPWVMRTYSGHSTPKASNELYRTNLAKGQTGLSIAFDLPTQIGYDPDSPVRWARSACPWPTSDTWPSSSTRSPSSR